jgi:N-acetylglutamate synthase-like GNAT family acetyltransferase
MHLGLKNGPLLPKGRIEMTRRRGRRRKQLLDDFFVVSEYEVMMTVHTVPLLSAALCGVISTVAINRNSVQRGISVRSF